VAGPIARDPQVQVEFNPQRVAAYRLVDEGRWSQAETVDEGRQTGNLEAGHAATALYEVIPVGHPLPTAERGEWVTVRFGYTDPASNTSQQLVQPLAGGVTRWAQASADCRFAAAVASFGMLLRQSECRGSATWADVRALARAAGGHEAAGRWAEFLELVDVAALTTKSND
jgi:Ca-activated chloride channel family protein